MYNNNKYLLLLVLLTGTLIFGCKKNVSDDKDKTLNDSTGITEMDTIVEVNLDNPIAQEKILLRFQPEVGKTYVIENNGSLSMSESQDSLNISYKSNKYGKMQMRVLSKDQENYKIEFTLIDVREVIKSDTSTIEYKYGKALADPNMDLNRKIEDCLVNAPLTITMSPMGVALDIQGYEKILAKVKALLPPNQNVPDQYLAANLGTPTENLENYFINYPDSAIQIGDTWTEVTASQMQGVPILLTNTYTLADRKNGVAYINFRTNIEMDEKQIPAEVMAQMTNVKFIAYINGVTEVEEKTGWPKVVRVSQGVDLSDKFEGHTTSSKQTSSSVIKWIQ